MCAACQGADRNSDGPANPKVAQQHPQYLVKQLQEFKSGKRANPIMTCMASALGDSDMLNVANWLSSNNANPNLAPFALNWLGLD